MKEYTIIGDINNKSYLICLAGRNLKNAKEILNKFLYNPDTNEKHLIEGYSNIRIQEIENEENWWNDPALVN